MYKRQKDGKVIVEDSFRALKHGPVPAYTYKALQIAEGKPLDGNFDEFLSDIEAVSYTHLDVYKRQGYKWKRVAAGNREAIKGGRMP